MKTGFDHKYVNIGLSKKGIRKTLKIHRLLATYFIPNPKNKSDVNHINGIKSDNRIENLEWCTKSENAIHAFKIGLHSHKGEKNTTNKLTDKDVLKIRQLNLSKAEISRLYNVSHSCISRVIRRKTWKHL